MACRQTPNPVFGSSPSFGTGSGVGAPVSTTRVQRAIRDGIAIPSILQIPVQQRLRRQEIENQNLQTQVTAASAAAAAAAAAATPIQVYTLTYTLIATQLKALSTTPVEILAASSGQIIEPIYLYIHRNQPAALFFSRNADLFHGVTAGGGGGPTAESVLGPFGLQSNVTQDTWANQNANSTTFTATPVNKSIYIKATGDNDLGFDPTNLNTVTLQLSYRLLASI